MMSVQKVGRPLGVVAEKVLDALSQHPMTVPQLVVFLQSTTNLMSYTCHRLVNRRKIRVVERIRVKGCCKPINCYALVRDIEPHKISNIIWGKE